MKKLVALTLIALSLQSIAQQIQLSETPKIDKNVELLSIVFRLAGSPEYNFDYFKIYNDKISNHFEPYKGHELIQFAKELRVRKSISYEAVMNLAIVLDDKLNSLTDFSTSIPNRWSKEDADKFIRLLKDFYKKANCEAFFKENEPLFEDVANRFRPVYQNLDLNWLSSFFGVNADKRFHLIVSIGCGGHSYGSSYTKPGSPENIFAIMGTWKMDETGIPVYNQGEYLPTAIHEFSHPFVNPIMEKNRDFFVESGKYLFKEVEYEMSTQQAYGDWQIMLNEALVRSTVIMYFANHGMGGQDIMRLINNEENKGFLWIRGLISALQKYGSQREAYPTLESYLPVLSEVYKMFKIPAVESISEFENNDTKVKPNVKTITIHFSRSLIGKGYSVNYGQEGGSAFPKINKISYTSDNQSVVLEVELKPSQEYQFILIGKNFYTSEGVCIKPYEVNFKTTE